jgi:adenosylhomocysteine nucleosidase
MAIGLGADVVINVGVAGSLSGELSIGDIAVARDLIQYDVDTSPIGDPVGMVSTVNRIDFPCAAWAVEAILDTAGQCDGIRAKQARIATGDRFIADAESKKWIRETFNADACEMEGCPIAQVCYINGVACAVIRAISDSSDGDHAMEYDQFCRMAAENSAKVVEGFLRGLNT